MAQLYTNERAYTKDEFAFGGGFAGVPSFDQMREAMTDAGTQTAEVTPQGDRWAYNWVMAAIVIFLFLYTVSRVLD